MADQDNVFVDSVPVEGNTLLTRPAVLRATIQVTRKATGKVDTYELTGYPVEEPRKPQED